MSSSSPHSPAPPPLSSTSRSTRTYVYVRILTMCINVTDCILRLYLPFVTSVQLVYFALHRLSWILSTHACTIYEYIALATRTCALAQESIVVAASGDNAIRIWGISDLRIRVCIYILYSLHSLFITQTIRIIIYVGYNRPSS